MRVHPMLKLVIADDEGQTTVVPLLRDEITIGRQAGNTIRLTERNVSRRHARLVKRNGAYIIEDLGSYNGVTLNGERVDQSAPIASGDTLAIGNYDLSLRAETMPPRREVIRASGIDTRPAPRLVVLSEPVAGAEFSLHESIMRIGRDERLDIWINHKSISHEHAEVRVERGVVTVFDLDSANGIRVNGIDTKRAIIQAGDVLELGEVRFRLLVPQGTRTLDELPSGALRVQAPPKARKPLFALAVIAALLMVGAGAVWVTTLERNSQAEQPAPVADANRPTSTVTVEPVPAVPVDRPRAPEARSGRNVPEVVEPPEPPVAPPQEWEDHLSRARAQLARGRIEQAYRVADQIPADSVLRRTPEFGEIRYRHVQAKIDDAERLLAAHDLDAAKQEARFVLGIRGITPMQRRDARRVVAEARTRQKRAASPEEALAQAHRCVGIGDNACVIRVLEGGQARSPAALALLIETYRAMDDMPAARRQMRAFVQRYPEDARTPRYEQMLGID